MSVVKGAISLFLSIPLTNGEDVAQTSKAQMTKYILLIKKIY